VKTVKVIKLFVFICFTYGLFFSAPLVYADDAVINNVLSSTETLFKALKEKNYTAVWNLLTIKSKNIILDDVCRETVKLGSECSKGQLNDDFAKGGSPAKAYWDNYITVFNPDMVLEHSTWKINLIKNEYAEVNILYKKSGKPAILKLYKEANIWKVGLEETFGTRKWLIK